MTFADSFWSSDYHLGYEALFDELYEGVKENQDFVQLISKRMELELIYGTQLESIETSLKPTSKRHGDDDYVSTIKNAFGKMNENFARQGGYHIDIAENIRSMVLDPFQKWCKEHEQRIGYLEQLILDKYKVFRAGKQNLDKLQKKYFNKCRMLEEFKSRYSEEELEDELQHGDLETSLRQDQDEADVDEELGQNYSFGGTVYDHRTARKLLADIVTDVELFSHKVPILGTYHNVSTGGGITQWVLDNMPEYKGNILKAESFGQDLINNGFIRLIGSMSGNKNFINSSQFFYQWKPAVFEITKLSEFDLKSEKNANYDPIGALGSRSNQFSDYFEDVKQAIGVTTVDYSNRSQYSKLFKEVSSLDVQYFQTTKELDRIRCEFEETVMDHLTFMEKCELDRLKAIKKVMVDFLSTFSNKVTAMKQICDELLVVEETIHPVSDLKFLIENYATGRFEPRVTLYDNYYNSNIDQTFGVDLNVKARLDRKAVPLLVQAVLSYLDGIYPELADDDERTNLWTNPVHLSKVHELRFKLNDVSEMSKVQEILKENDPMVITNVLKLYFMELPDSIVPHSYFDLIKTLYQSYPTNSTDPAVGKTRINGLQNSLVELPVCNLATLDAILTHFNRLVNIIGSKNEALGADLQSKLCREFGNLVLRPKYDAQSALDSKNIHSYSIATETLQQSFLADLFQHKDTIFSELRRRSSAKSGPPLRANSTRSAPQSHTLTPKATIVASSKSRLENRLKKAVSKTTEPEKAETKASESSTVLKVKSNTSSPDKSSSLRRSTSPNKKLNGSSTIISSRPAKKDIVYTSSRNSSDLDLAKPQFVPGLERKTSVKDLASKFEAPPVPPKNGSAEDAIVVE